MRNISEFEEEQQECGSFDLDSQEQNQYQTTRRVEQDDQVQKENNQFFDESSGMNQFNECDSNSEYSIQNPIDDCIDFNNSNHSESFQQQEEKCRKLQIKQPGETKNMPKCYGRQIQNYIKDIQSHNSDCELKELCKKQEIKKFLNIKSDDINRKKLAEFINSEAGQIIASTFFGNCRWIYGLVKENKTNVESYFRHNISYFYEAQKKKKTKPN